MANHRDTDWRTGRSAIVSTLGGVLFLTIPLLLALFEAMPTEGFLLMAGGSAFTAALALAIMPMGSKPNAPRRDPLHHPFSDD